MNNQEQNNIAFRGDDYQERVTKAFADRDTRHVIPCIKNQFPGLRTAELNLRLIQLIDGPFADDELLTVVENIAS